LSFQQLASIPRKNTKRTRVKRHQPVRFSCRDSLRPRSPENSWWSWRRELNPRPSDYKSDALPAELRQRRSNRVRIAEEVLELQGGAVKFQHADSQVCGKARTPLLIWTPIILFVLYRLAENQLGSKHTIQQSEFAQFKSHFRAGILVPEVLPDGTIPLTGATAQVVQRT
jgi:hypothetical protein